MAADDLFRGTVYRNDAHLGQTLGVRIKVISVSDEGLAWLDENAPGWRERVSLSNFQAQHFVPDESMVQEKEAILTHLMGELTYAVAKKLVETFEPLVTRL